MISAVTLASSLIIAGACRISTANTANPAKSFANVFSALSFNIVSVSFDLIVGLKSNDNGASVCRIYCRDFVIVRGSV